MTTPVTISLSIAALLAIFVILLIKENTSLMKQIEQHYTNYWEQFQRLIVLSAEVEHERKRNDLAQRTIEQLLTPENREITNAWRAEHGELMAAFNLVPQEPEQS